MAMSKRAKMSRKLCKRSKVQGRVGWIRMLEDKGCILGIYLTDSTQVKPNQIEAKLDSHLQQNTDCETGQRAMVEREKSEDQDIGGNWKAFYPGRHDCLPLPASQPRIRTD